MMSQPDTADENSMHCSRDDDARNDDILDERNVDRDGSCSSKALDPNHDNTSPTPTTERDSDDESDTASVGGQRNTMTSTQLRIAIPALSVCLFVSFIDQTSVSTATPAIAVDLSTGTATSWIGTSFLIASTAFQLINGRLSDIFGRKNLLLISLMLMALGDLGCGFAQSAVQLFVLRAIAGIGGGGINSLVMIIVSDITTLQNRGKYQGR
jgi:Na+/melibiose symporter-like transporter